MRVNDNAIERHYGTKQPHAAYHDHCAAKRLSSTVGVAHSEGIEQTWKEMLLRTQVPAIVRRQIDPARNFDVLGDR